MVSNQASEIQALSGDSSGAEVVRSGPDITEAAVHRPGHRCCGLQFVVQNRGGADVPTFEIAAEEESTLLSIVDRGEVGDLAITGSGLRWGLCAGGSARGALKSLQTATLDVLSGVSDDAHDDHRRGGQAGGGDLR